METRNLSDEQIVRLVESGNTDIFEVIVSRYQNHVYKRMYLACRGNVELAKSEAISTFVHLYNQILAHKYTLPINKWIIIETMNRYIDIVGLDRK